MGANPDREWRNGSRFPCAVGVELFTPPELVGHNLGSLRRTPNHDAFGLAVLIFHLLFMGRHPFAGRYLCKGEMPIERAIAECRFAYSHDSARTKMSPPPLTLPLAAATLSIAECFERAFHPDGRRGGRPTPEDWVRTLDALKASLTDCTSVAWHQYPPGLRACPWCEIERASGAKLYGGVIRVASAAITDVQGLWGRYLALADPGPASELPREKDWIPPVAQGRFVRWRRRLSALAIGVPSLCGADAIATASPVAALASTVVAGLLVVLMVRGRRPAPRDRAELAAALAEAERAWQTVAEEWRFKARAPDLAPERSIILGLKAKLDGLAAERAAHLRALARPVSESQQRLTYLEQYRIDEAGLFNIGAARIAVLQSWGVETATDIEEGRISSIPGFGRNLTERLVNWREGLEQRFHFEPAVLADPRDVQRLDRELAARRTRYMKELRAAIIALEKRINAIADARRALWQQLEGAFNQRMLARHNAQTQGL